MAVSEPLVSPIETTFWADLRESLRNLRGWVFRGQQRVSWPLQSSLERAIADSAKRPQAEANLRFRFEQLAANYIPLGQLPDNKLDWLAAMQHHGAPTRLLDFTRSPYIAAYFAIEDASREEPCAIWAIDEAWCREQADRALREAGVKSEFPTLDWAYSGMGFQPVRMATPAGPIRLSARQEAQQALFVVPGDTSLPFELNLRAMVSSGVDIDDHVRCYSVRSENRGEMLRDLRLMNITRASLYPGLDGFAQSLRYELVDEDAQRATMRQVIAGQ